MIKLFAVVNREILEDLGENFSGTFTRIHYLLNGLKNFCDIDVEAIGFTQIKSKDPSAVVYNNIIKSVVAARTAYMLAKDKPMVYFAYPYSLTTPQNRAIFRICKMLNLKIILDIHDTIEQADAIGTGKAVFNSDLEGYFFRNATLILALNKPMWRYLQNKYGIPSDKRVVFVPNAYEEGFMELYPDAYKHADNRFNICYLGGITKNRGIDILIKACKRLHEKYPYLRLYLIGSYGEGISSELKKAILESDFIIRREVPRKELPGLIKDIDLCVLPYDPNVEYMNFSSPLKFFEYIGTGKPILCTMCESLMDLDKGEGIVYYKYDDADLESKIDQMINNPQNREKLSEKIMAMRPLHTWNKRSEDLCRAIESL
ncbi:MAG: glycosyltransferase [Methanotrichaceae archaeon]